MDFNVISPLGSRQCAAVTKTYSQIPPASLFLETIVDWQNFPRLLPGGKLIIEKKGEETR